MDTRLAFFPSRSAFSLPGGWPSTDSLAETLTLPNANPPYEELRFIVSDIPRSEGENPRSATGERSLRNSVATYNDDSDDFYSFVESQEDDDAEVASLTDASDISGVHPQIEPTFHQVPEKSGSINSENLGTTSTASILSLDHTDMTSSDDTSSSEKMFDAPETSVSSPPSEESNCTPQSDYNYSHSRPTLLNPLTKDAGPTPRTSLVTSSSRQSINSDSSSSGSAHLGDEEFSHHLDHSEDESAVSHTQVYNVIAHVHHTNTSEESLPTHILSSPPRLRSLQIQRRVIVNQDSQLDIRHLAQPDGHNPWTLSLEPALVNLSEFATASRTSVSVESSSMTYDLAPAASPEPRLQTPVPPQTPTGPKSFSVAQNEFTPRVGLGRPSVDLRPPHYAPPPSYSGFTIPHPTEKKDVVQKTKTFYQKMKRFFTPKSSKRNETKGISNQFSIAAPINTGLSPLPFSSPYANTSSSQWSLNRRTFQRSAKSSAPSVALSCTPDIPHNSTYHHPHEVTQETRHTFEYRRPAAQEGIKPPNKRNRRFSVPTPFYAPSLAPSALSSSRNISVPSPGPFAKRWSRIGESNH